MKVAIVFFQLCLLFAIYQVGNYIQQLLHIPIPGSIIGMLLLFILLQLKVVKVKWIANGANFLLSYLTLLFIPATVGIIQYVGFFSGMGILSIVVVIISTIHSHAVFWISCPKSCNPSGAKGGSKADRKKSYGRQRGIET